MCAAESFFLRVPLTGLDNRRLRYTLLPSLAAGEIAAFSLAWRGESAIASGTAWAWLVLGGLVLGSWLFFCIWTWQRLVQKREAESNRLVYDYGVLGWELAMWVTMAITNAAREVGGLSNMFSAPFAGALLQNAFIGFPLWLWSGYLWGRATGMVFRSPK